METSFTLPNQPLEMTTTIRRKDYFCYLQAILNNQLKESAISLEKIVSIIRGELNNFDTNNIVLNMAIKVYFQLIAQRDESDNMISEILQSNLQIEEIDQRKYVLLLSIMTVNDSKLSCDESQLNEICVTDLKQALTSNHPALPLILKCINKLTDKFVHPQIVTLDFEEIYFCLQYNRNGVKEELLTLLSNICTDKSKAQYYFQCASNFLPWTNKYKYYILGCTVRYYCLSELLSQSTYSDEIFFSGLQLSLLYKNLLVSSQFFVKNISEHDDIQFEKFIADVLLDSSIKMIRNLYIFWFPFIKNKCTIFNFVKKSANFCRMEVNFLMQSTNYIFSSIILFNMYPKDISIEFESLFRNISSLMFNESSQFNLETQYFIYKFIVENMHLFPIKECLEYIYNVFEHQKICDDTDMRDKFVSRIPIILEQITKQFINIQKKGNEQTRAYIENNILRFFCKIENFIQHNMGSLTYQNKIFALKLLKFLFTFQIIYDNNTSLLKSRHSSTRSELLGKFLKSKNVFLYENVSDALYNNLNNPIDYVDTRSIVMSLLRNVPLPCTSFDIIKQIEMFCIQAEIDDCYLSTVYAELLINNFPTDTVPIANMYSSILKSLNTVFKLVKTDALLACKTQGGHLFSYVNVISHLLKSNDTFEMFLSDKSLILIEEIVLFILGAFCSFSSEIYCASFEEIDVGLQLIVENSDFYVSNYSNARKFLLLSFWYTLRACSEVATIVCEIIVNRCEEQLMENDVIYLKQCIDIIIHILTKCRHKGAIEAAGACIGKITKYITSKLNRFSEPYRLLEKCVKDIYNIESKCVSTTRRGAGYPMLFLHIVKNESNRYNRPILKTTLNDLLKIVYKIHGNGSVKDDGNIDRLDVLSLHLLCVLMRDTEIKDLVKFAYEDLIIATSPFLDSSDWSLCNGTLQLFGALVPKIVGQQYLPDKDHMIFWISAESTYDEIVRKYPHMCEFILHFLTARKTCTRAIISFLDFLQRIDFLHSNNSKVNKFIKSHRMALWSLLKHVCAKVRKVAAICFVRAHEFRNDLPHILLKISEILFKVKNENFMDGIILVLHWGIIKVRMESLNIIEKCVVESFENVIKQNLLTNFNLTKTWKKYTISKLLQLLTLLNINIDKIHQHLETQVETTLDYDFRSNNI